ncbi:hypothetical protein [Desulfatiferula olefinivorans]
MIPLDCCWVLVVGGVVPVAAVDPPKAREARSTPMPMVSIKNPSLNPMSSMPTDGPWRNRGPSFRLLVEVAPAVTAALRVKVWVMALLAVPFTVRKLFARMVTVTSPSLNRSMVLVTLASFR